MSVQNKIREFWSFALSGGLCGLMLLLRPIVLIAFQRQRDLSAYSAVDFSAMVFILFSLLCFLLACKELYSRDMGFSRKLVYGTPLLVFILYTVLALISMAWSVNYMLTGFRAFECLAYLLTIIAAIGRLFNGCSYKTIIKWTRLYVSVDIVCTVASVARYTLNIGEILTHSQMMATVFFFLALYDSSKNIWNYIIYAFSIFSLSTVAYIGMALGAISTFWSEQKYRTIVFIGALTLAGVIAVVGPYSFVKSTVFFDKKEISIHETTGRDRILEVALKSLDGNSIGYGFFSGEPYVLYNHHLGAINGHNSLISAALGLGYSGVALLMLFFFLMACVTFSSHIPMKFKATAIGCFCVGFLQCMGNPGLGSRVYGSWMPVAFCFTLICAFYLYGKNYSDEDLA